MDVETKEVIAKQTNIEDIILIEKTYYECGGDVGATILKLMNVAYKEKPKPVRTQFDEYREILDEKAMIYQQILEKSRGTVERNKST